VAEEGIIIGRLDGSGQRFVANTATNEATLNDLIDNE